MECKYKDRAPDLKHEMRIVTEGTFTGSAICVVCGWNGVAPDGEELAGTPCSCACAGCHKMHDRLKFLENEIRRICDVLDLAGLVHGEELTHD